MRVGFRGAMIYSMSVARLCVSGGLRASEVRRGDVLDGCGTERRREDITKDRDDFDKFDSICHKFLTKQKQTINRPIVTSITTNRFYFNTLL